MRCIYIYIYIWIIGYLSLRGTSIKTKAHTYDILPDPELVGSAEEAATSGGTEDRPLIRTKTIKRTSRSSFSFIAVPSPKSDNKSPKSDNKSPKKDQKDQKDQKEEEKEKQPEVEIEVVYLPSPVKGIQLHFNWLNFNKIAGKRSLILFRNGHSHHPYLNINPITYPPLSVYENNAFIFMYIDLNSLLCSRSTCDVIMICTDSCTYDNDRRCKQVHHGYKGE